MPASHHTVSIALTRYQSTGTRTPVAPGVLMEWAKVLLLPEPPPGLGSFLPAEASQDPGSILEMAWVEQSLAKQVFVLQPQGRRATLLGPRTMVQCSEGPGVRGSRPMARSELFLPSLPREAPSLGSRGPPLAPCHLPCPWDTWQAHKKGTEAVVPD